MKRFRAFLWRIRDFRRYRKHMIYDRHHSIFTYNLRYLAFSARCRFGRTIPAKTPERATAILVSFKRIHNMEPLVRSCLRCGWIDKVVVLNNNPDEKLADSVQIKDPRITLIDEGSNKGAMQRYVFASKSNGKYFVSLDDDNFLYPEQLTKLFTYLIENPSIPHGMFAQRWLGRNDEDPFQSFQNCILEVNEEVDILNRVYFFTKAHADECMRLARVTGSTTDKSLRALSPVDDVFLAFSGHGRPLTHNVGKFVECPSQSDPTIAQWMQKNFGIMRVQLFQKLTVLKPRS